MNTYYCVFWYPTIFHQGKNNNFRRNPTVSIAVNDEINNLFVKITEEPANVQGGASQSSILSIENPNDLVFELTDIDGNTFKTRLSWVGYNQLGFVVYAYDRDDMICKYWNRFGEGEQERIIRKAAKSIGVYIKRRHRTPEDFEPDDELIRNYTIDRVLITLCQHVLQLSYDNIFLTDSAFENKFILYYYSKEYEDGNREYLNQIPSLSEANNPVISWYINQFENHFVSQANYLSALYNRWSKDLDDSLSLKRRIYKALERNSREEMANIIEEIKIRDSVIQNQITGIAPPDIQSYSNYSFDNDAELKNKLIELFESSYRNVIYLLYKTIDVLSNKCTDILIDYTYCKALLESKYYKEENNNEFISLGIINQEYIIRDVRRKRTFNIRNSIQFIEAIKEKCVFLKNRLTEVELEQIFDLSNSIKGVFNEINSNSNSIQNIESLSNETAKSNVISTLLGCLALALAFVSVISYLEKPIWKLFCLSGAIVALLYGLVESLRFFVKRQKERREKWAINNTS